MKLVKLLLLCCLLYCVTGCEKSGVAPGESTTGGQAATEQQLNSGTVSPPYPTQSYLRFDNYRGTLLMLPASPSTYGYIRNPSGVWAGIRAPQPPCDTRLDPNCPPRSSTIVGIIDALNKRLTIRIYANPLSKIVTYSIAGDYTFFKAYTMFPNQRFQSTYYKVPY